MIFRIILSIGVATEGASAAIAFAGRALIAWGLRRASLSALYAAWLATGTKAILVASKLRARTEIVISEPRFQMLYDELGEVQVSYWLTSMPLAQRTGQNAYQAVNNVRNSVSVNSWWNSLGTVGQSEKGMQVAIDHYIKSSNILRVVAAEKTTARNNLLSGIPLALAAFFLTPPSAGAQICSPSSPNDFFGLPDTGCFTERVYGWAETQARANLLPSGTWVLQPLTIIFKINIGEPLDKMDPQIYNELVAWKNSLNVGQVLDEIESQGNPTGVNYYQETTNQANNWVSGLNSGTATPGGVSIQAGASVMFNSSVTVNTSVANKTIRANIGSIDKLTNVLVRTSANSCDLIQYLLACSDAEVTLNAPAINCKGFMLNYNGELGVVSFSMGKPVGPAYDFLNDSSAPTLDSLLLRFVVNGKLMELSEVANDSRMGYLYSNTQQIDGTNSFFINKDGSIQERFLLSVLSDNLLG